MSEATLVGDVWSSSQLWFLDLGCICARGEKLLWHVLLFWRTMAREECIEQVSGTACFRLWMPAGGVQVCSLLCLCFLFLGDRERNRNFFNSHFGSIFRTDENPTYFLRRLSRFADIYMASLSCLLNYEPDYTFYPRRTPLQHELPGWSDQLCTGTFRIPFLQETVQIK